MSLKKTAKLHEPHATYMNSQGWEWRVLKVYATAKGRKVNQYERWYCAVRSPMTYGSWEYGDTYVGDVVRYGRQMQSTEAFAAYMEEV